MNKETSNKERRRHTNITALGISVLIFFILVSVVSATRYPMTGNYPYDKAIESNPQYPMVLNNGVNVYSQQNKYDDSMNPYGEAIENDPQDSDIWNNKGDALSKQHKYGEALQAYDKAIEIDPQDSDAWNNRGDALKELGNNNEALQAYNKAIEINRRIQMLE